MRLLARGDFSTHALGFDAEKSKKSETLIHKPGINLLSFVKQTKRRSDPMVNLLWIERSVYEP